MTPVEGLAEAVVERHEYLLASLRDHFDLGLSILPRNVDQLLSANAALLVQFAMIIHASEGPRS